MPPHISLVRPSPGVEQTLDPEAAADHLTKLYRLAWSLTGSPHIAEELTQETYVRVLARPRRLREGDDFRYLARTLRNVARDHWRSQRRRPTHLPDWHLVDEPSGSAARDPELAALASELYAAIAALPDPLREVVAAVDVAGMTYAEAAESLEIPLGTVMSRLYRARERLAGSLGETAQAA